MEKIKSEGDKFEELVNIMRVLRSERGCPWDRQQDVRSITNFFLEEVYEAVEAVEADDSHSLGEELGDVLMEVVFLAQIYSEKGEFNIADVLEGIVDKMVRRHPHVFGSPEVKIRRGVVEEWQRLKNKEKEGETLFDGLSASSPALLAAFQVGQRAAALGFDWEKPGDVLAKVKEEIEELEKALEKKQGQAEELGDILFALANLCRKLGFNPELALRQANEKFKRRFLSLEARLKARGKALGHVSLEEMDKIWEELKRGEQAE